MTETASEPWPEPLHPWALMRLRDVIREFRKLDAGIPSSYLDAYLTVALQPGLGPTDYARLMGASQPVASRVLMEVGEKARERDAPFWLVVSAQAPESRRNIQYQLSPKGYALALKLGRMLQGRT